MASTALLGFLKGSSGAALDSMELREKEAAERRKLEMAARIDHEYFSKRELFKEGLPSNVQARKERQRKMEREEELHPLAVEGARLGLDSTRQEMELGRNRDARADRLTDAQVDSYRASASRARTSGLDSKEGAGVDDFTVANELMAKFADEVKVLEGVVPPDQIRDVAAAAARTALRRGDTQAERERLAQELFRNQLRQFDYNIRPSETRVDKDGNPLPEYDRNNFRIRGLENFSN